MTARDTSSSLPRVRLQTAAAVLRAAAAPPSTDGTAPSTLRDALLELREALDEHVRDAEADDGFLARIVADAPWLAPQAEHLRRDHATLVRDCAALVARLGEEEDEARLREGAERLARHADDHHHRGTALLLDAYELDISASD